MNSRLFVAGLAVLCVAGCQAAETPAPKEAAAPAAVVVASPAQVVLTEVWQAANPGVTPPDLAGMAATFDPTFAKIVNAPNDADNAAIASTLAFIRAVQTAAPALCAGAPVAKFEPTALAAVPAEALPAFRTMLTERLALVAAGAALAAPPEDLMSGSMQNFSAELGDGASLEIVPQVATSTALDANQACAATITIWEALDKAPQSPQLMRMVYAGEF